MLKNILSNKFFQLALILWALGGLISDYIGSGYLIVIIVGMAVIVYSVFEEIQHFKIYNQKNISIPIVFNISNPADSQNALNQLFHILENKDTKYKNHKNNLKKYFNIIEEDLIFKYDGNIFDEKRFVDFLKIVKHEIKQLEKKTPKHADFHIIYIGPIANAIALGTVFATEGVTLYQYNKSSNAYTIAFEVQDREFKELIDNYKIIDYKQIGEIDKNITVAIELASHKIALDRVKEPIIYLQSKIGSTLKEPTDFIRANQEIYSVINGLQQKYSHIRLVYSMPVMIGFLLGMSIQNYWDIELTQYDDGEYKSVIKHLNEVKYYF